jgi:hypothetical protein
MSTKLIFGDLLNIESGIIAHQVNYQKHMGGGVARLLANKYPSLEPQYVDFIEEFNENYIDETGEHAGDHILGQVYYHETEGGELIIANCFSQMDRMHGDRVYDGGFQLGITSYNDILTCFSKIRNEYGWDLPLYVPFGYGCGIAGGNWVVVEALLEAFDVTVVARPQDYEKWINEMG